MARVYCSACNQVFSAADAGVLQCPRCGLQIPCSDESDPAETLPMAAPGPDIRSGGADFLLSDDAERAWKLHIYDCRKVLGRGGMGVVYLARNQMLHRFCALKILLPQRSAQDVDYISRFENEGRAAAALVHPNTVTTHAIGRVDEHHFLEMEYVSGRSLQREIDDTGALGPIRSTGMAVGIASGLAAAHRLGIVHRDLKPDNVMVTPASVPKIADFGLAKQILGAELPGTTLAGTPHYMAPELLSGQPATTTSDVFALGVCYYQMLTGCYPFQGDSLSAVMAKILSGDYVSVRRRNPGIPLDVAECVSMLLAGDPDRRPRDGAGASQLLQAVMGAVRDLDVLVYEAFQGMSTVSCDEDGARFRATLQLRNGRHQTVYIENSDHGAGDRLLLIYSVCCEAAPDFYENALRLNAHMQHGGISIRDIDGRPCFVMVDTHLRATVSGEDIRRSVLEIGTRADSVELQLTDRDLN